MSRSNRKRYVSGPGRGERAPTHSSLRFIDGIDTRTLLPDPRTGKPGIEFEDYLERAKTPEAVAYRAIREAFGLTEEAIGNMKPQLKTYWSSLVAAVGSFSVVVGGVESLHLPEIHIVTLHHAAQGYGDPQEAVDPTKFLQGIAAHAEGQRLLAQVGERPPIPNDPNAFFAEAAANYVYKPAR